MLNRFMNKVYPEPNTGCWLWGGGLTNGGYGRFKFEGRTQLAHRISYRFYNGGLCDERQVCHSCDTPSCVNPDHLFSCNQKENISDAILKGRVGQWEHGTRAGYDYRRCRCDLCKKANTLRHKTYRETKNQK